MQKAIIRIRAVLGRILDIGISVQIIFGMLWMCCSFTGVQWFLDSSFYVKVSESLICDEYTGILYPLLLLLTGKNYAVLCLLQVVLAFGAGCFFTGALGISTSKRRIWGSLGIMTYPMVLQCHMAVLPNSFTFSVFLLLLSFVLRALKKDRKDWRRELLGVHVCWLVAALLMPEYFWLGMIPVGSFWIYDLVKYRKNAGMRVTYHLLLAAVFAGMIVSLSACYTQEGYYGRARGSVCGTVFARVVWPGLAQYYMEWPEEVRDAVSDEVLEQALKRVDMVRLLLQPQLESKLDWQEVADFYREIGGKVLKTNYWPLSYEIGWDVLGNVFPLYTMQEQLKGRGYGSYCARNYETMRMECPGLTYYYIQYATWWSAAGLFIAACLAVLAGIRALSAGWAVKFQRTSPLAAGICILSGLTVAFWYVMTDAGAWDYKKALLTECLFTVWMILAAAKSAEEEQ